jgi:hypothetical protein
MERNNGTSQNLIVSNDARLAMDAKEWEDLSGQSD